MSLLVQALNIKKTYGTRTILDFDKFLVYTGDKIGIVGANGAGKSTLLGILSGEIPPDEGNLVTNCAPAFIHQLENTPGTLSGGEAVKQRIVFETGKSDQVVFADEPTANLDAGGIAWVRHKLQGASTLLLVSHDRDLLNAVCTRIVEIEDGKLAFYTGSYREYEQARAKIREQQQLQYEEYQRKKAQLEAAISGKQKKVSRQKSKQKQETRRNSSEARLGGDKRASSTKKVEREAKVLHARLERLEQVAKQREPVRLRMNFSLTNPPRNRHVVTCRDLNFRYENKILFQNANFSLPGGKKTALTGKNGCGKTTLLRLIYQGHPAITKAPLLKPGYLCQGFEQLDLTASLLDNVLSTSIQDRSSVCSILAGLLFFSEDLGKKAGVLSGGERMRLSLAKLIASDVNALLLDEPTNYLDIPSVKAVQDMLSAYPGTVLLVSHDQQFIRQVTDSRLCIDGQQVKNGETTRTAAPPANRMLLELRRTQLVSAIYGADPVQKDLLEAEYRQVLEQLSNLP